MTKTIKTVKANCNKEEGEEKMNKLRTCCLCGIQFRGWGNNPYPLASMDDGWCCDSCNSKYVIPARIIQNLENRCLTKKEIETIRRYAKER